MTDYVLGFRFRVTSLEGCAQVALIRKVRPTWQAGKLNGIGGKVEPIDRTAEVAMTREFREETGVVTEPSEWKLFGRLTHDGNVIHLFKSFGDVRLSMTTDERPGWFWVADLGRGVEMMRNLAWLIPMALDKDNVFARIEDHSRIPEVA